MTVEILEAIARARRETKTTNRDEAEKQARLNSMFEIALDLINQNRPHPQDPNLDQEIRIEEGVDIPVDYQGEEIIVSLSRRVPFDTTTGEPQEVTIAVKGWEPIMRLKDLGGKVVGWADGCAETHAEIIRQFNEVLDFMMGKTTPQLTQPTRGDGPCF